MATYTAQQLNGAGTPTEELTGLKRFSLTNPSSGSAYFTVEQVDRRSDGTYGNSPTNALGTYATFNGIDVDTLITSSFISSVVVPPGASSYTFTPTTTVADKSSMLRATGGITLIIS